jgi:hypothetical protein
MKDGFHSVELESSNSESELCVSTSVMDAARRITQSKTTKGWLNPPYNRYGCLRISRRIHPSRDSTKRLTKQPGKQVASAYIPILDFYFSCRIRDLVAWICAT